MMHGNCVWYSSEVKRKQKKNLTEMRQNNLSMAEHSQRCQIKLKLEPPSLYIRLYIHVFAYGLYNLVVDRRDY